MTTRLLLALAIALVPLGAAAERPGQYWGLSVGDAYVTDDDDEELGASNIGLHVGYKLFDLVGVELQAGGAASGKKINGRDSRDTRYGGAFARFDLPLERMNVFVLAGGAVVRYDEGPPEGIVDESDIAAGVGVELFGTERTALRLEYMNYADGTYETFGLGFVHHFDWPSLR